MTRLPNDESPAKKLFLKQSGKERCNYLHTGNSLSIGACVIDFAENEVLALNDQLRQWISEQGKTISMSQVFAFLPELDRIKLDLTKNLLENERIPSPWQTTLNRDQESSMQAMVHLTPLEAGQKTWHLLLIQPFEQPDPPVPYTDVVTGLPDRRALEDWRRQWQYKNPGEPNPHALLFLDLDDFKQINDQHGHAYGDRILEMLAERWQKSLRGDDLVVRYGGDEFVILLASVQTAEAAMPVIQRLKACTAAPIQVEETAFSITVSIGLALANDINVPIEILLANADRDMYTQKGLA